MTQDILIAPGSGEPFIDFRATGVPNAIKLTIVSGVVPASGTSELSFEGTHGQLLSISDNLASGTIFSVSDITGLPLVEADASGDVKIGQYGRNVGIGSGVLPAYQLDVFGTGNFHQGIRFSDGTTQTIAGAPATVSLTAGDGLTGGGTIASDRTFAVGAGTLIDVQADQVDVDLSESAAATIAHGDHLIFLDGGATGAASKGSTDDLANLFAGDGLTKSNSVMAVNVDDSTIETNSDAIRVKDDGITLAKMAGLVRGKIIYGDSNGDPAALALGGADQVLTSDGTDVAWADNVNTYVSGVAAYASGNTANIAFGSNAEGDILYHNGTSFVRLAKGTDNHILKMNGNVPNWESAGGGAGTMNAVKSNDSAVGGSDIATLDFSSRFSVTEDPDTEINVELATVAVAYGGTNATSFADKAVLITQDSGTDTVAAAAMDGNGELLIGGTSGPAVATLTQGSNMTITNADGAITLASAGAGLSDEELKDNIVNLSVNGLDKIDAFRPVEFDWNQTAFDEHDGKMGHDFGLIAQEVEQIFPELVSLWRGHKAVDYGKLTVILIQAVKELKQEIEQLKNSQ